METNQGLCRAFVYSNSIRNYHGLLSAHGIVFINVIEVKYNRVFRFVTYFFSVFLRRLPFCFAHNPESLCGTELVEFLFGSHIAERTIRFYDKTHNHRSLDILPDSQIRVFQVGKNKFREGIITFIIFRRLIGSFMNHKTGIKQSLVFGNDEAAAFRKFFIGFGIELKEQERGAGYRRSPDLCRLEDKIP